jgi:hypothetical protein
MPAGAVGPATIGRALTSSAQGYISRPDPPLCAAFVALCGKTGGQRRVDFESNVYSAHISLMTGFGTAPPYRRSRWAYA